MKRLLAFSCVLALFVAVCARPSVTDAANAPGTIGICWPTFNIELRSGFVCFAGTSEILPIAERGAAEALGGIPNFRVHRTGVVCGGEILLDGSVDTTNID